MADDPKKARIDEINSKLHEPRTRVNWIGGAERAALLDELMTLQGSPVTDPNEIPIPREVQRQINELRQSPAFLDKRHMDHDLAVADLTALYEGVVSAARRGSSPGAAGAAGGGGGAGGTGTGATAPGSAEPPKTPAQRLAEVEQNPGYRDARHPQHSDLVSQASGIYRELAASAGDGEAA